MSSYLEKQIANESRHQFIYAENGEKRKNFLTNIAENNPIIIGQNKPSIVYMKDFTLPLVNSINPDTDVSLLPTLSKEYLSFSIATNILETMQKQIEINLLNEKIQLLLERVNRLFKNQDFDDIKDLETLLAVLKKAKEFYRIGYIDLIKDGKIKSDIDSLPISFLLTDNFIYYLKKALENNSYFGIIIDQQEEMPRIMQKTINSYISSRINHNISMKVACHPKEWNETMDLNGNKIDYIHDYSIIELDDTYKTLIEEIKNKYI